MSKLQRLFQRCSFLISAILIAQIFCPPKTYSNQREFSAVLNRQIKTQIKLGSDIDGRNMQDPIGYRNGKINYRFTNKIEIINQGSKALKNFNLILNDKDFRSFPSLSKFLAFTSDKQRNALKFFDFWINNIYHSDLSIPLGNGKNPFIGLIGLGFSLCGSNSYMLSNFLSHQNIPSRSVNFQGHVAHEFFIDNRWQIIDGDLNSIYLALNNNSLSSFLNILADPFLAIRTKPNGKYESENLDRSWFTMSLFDFVRKSSQKKINTNEQINHTPLNHVFDLFPNEKIIFHHDNKPNLKNIVNDNEEWAKISSSFADIEQTVILNDRLKNKSFEYSSPYPIYRIANNTPGPIKVSPINKTISTNKDLFLESPHQNLIFSPEAKIGSISVHSFGALNALPKFQKGSNVISLATDANPTKININALINIPDIQVPEIPPLMNRSELIVFDNQIPDFNLDTKNLDYEKLWWQISLNQEFIGIPPNFDHIQDSSSKIVLSPITDTFLNNSQKYFLRYKVKKDGLWSEWSNVQAFTTTKPMPVTKLICVPIPGNKAFLKWESTNQADVKYFVFGSNSFDFVPDIYSEKLILKMEGGKVKKYSNKKNLIEITNESQLITDEKYSYFRIVSEKNGRFSVPSKLINMGYAPAMNLNKKEIREIDLSKKGFVLQTKHNVTRQENDQNKWKNHYVAKRVDLIPAILEPYKIINITPDNGGLEVSPTSKGLRIRSIKNGIYKVSFSGEFKFPFIVKSIISLINKFRSRESYGYLEPLEHNDSFFVIVS